MPYKSEHIKIQGTEYDRRRKLTEEDKNYIKLLYEKEKMSQRELASMFGVSKRKIQFILDPDKEKRNKELRKQHIKEGRYKCTKEERASIMREHRRYKEKLHKENKI